MFTSSIRRARGVPRKKIERKERVPVIKSATICIDGADLTVECTIRDIHNFGARFSVVNSVGIPDEFLLISRTEDLCARARVAWRRGNELGVRFLRRASYADEGRMRQDQQKQFSKITEYRRQEQERVAYAAQKAGIDPASAEAPAPANPMKRAAQMRILGFDPKVEVTADELKRAYRMKAMTMHPDRGGDPNDFQSLSIAYRELTFACEAGSS